MRRSRDTSHKKLFRRRAAVGRRGGWRARSRSTRRREGTKKTRGEESWSHAGLSAGVEWTVEGSGASRLSHPFGLCPDPSRSTGRASRGATRRSPFLGASV